MHKKKEFIERLENNEIVALPTETVFGLFAKISLENKHKLNEIKKRNRDQELQVSFYSFEEIKKFCNISKFQEEILKKELFQKKSFLVKLKKEYKVFFNQESLLVRLPKKTNNTKFLISILKETGPLFSTSANFSKEKNLYKWKEIKKNFGILVYQKNIKKNQKSSTIVSLLEEKKEIIRK